MRSSVGYGDLAGAHAPVERLPDELYKPPESLAHRPQVAGPDARAVLEQVILQGALPVDDMIDALLHMVVAGLRHPRAEPHASRPSTRCE